jgi:hypothetical protein
MFGEASDRTRVAFSDPGTHEIARSRTMIVRTRFAEAVISV